MQVLFLALNLYAKLSALASLGPRQWSTTSGAHRRGFVAYTLNVDQVLTI